MKKIIVFALSALVAGGVFARAGSDERVAHDPEVAVPPIEYRSVFEDYRSFEEVEIASWRELNDEVGRVGGHRGVLKAGSSSEAHPSPKETEESGSHHGHGGAR